jgi:alanine racemase
MDMITVDVTDCNDIEVGSPAILWGDDPHIDEVALHSGTIGYELMTRLTTRAPVRYLNA